MRNLFISGISMGLLALSGCNDAAPRPVADQQAYFDVPGFIQKQISAFEKEQPALQKTVGFGHEKPETKNLKQVNWKEELTLFQEIDLNKKALAGNYTETKTVLPEGEKLVYLRNSDSNAPITFLEVIKDKQQQVKTLRAIYLQQNTLFFNREERKLQTNANQQISKFEISGVQKVLFFDSTSYQVKSLLP